MKDEKYEKMQADLAAERKKHKCIFEDRPCRYANNVDNVFECKAPSDDEMPCRRHH
jgi:hypothetical protein